MSGRRARAIRRHAIAEADRQRAALPPNQRGRIEWRLGYRRMKRMWSRGETLPGLGHK